MQATQQLQRVCVTVQRTEAAAHHGRAETGQILPELGRTHHLEGDAANLAVDPVQQIGARPDIRFAEPEPEAARLLQAGIDLRQLEEFLLQLGP
jgi:hypothetical protein